MTNTPDMPARHLLLLMRLRRMIMKVSHDRRTPPDIKTILDESIADITTLLDDGPGVITHTSPDNNVAVLRTRGPTTDTDKE